MFSTAFPIVRPRSAKLAAVLPGAMLPMLAVAQTGLALFYA